MKNSWSLLQAWIFQIYPYFVFSTQFSLPWNSEFPRRGYRAGPPMRVYHKGYLSGRAALTFCHNKPPGTGMFGLDWVSNILMISGLLPWFRSWREFELLWQRHRTLSHIDRIFKLEKLRIISSTSCIFQTIAECITRSLLQLIVLIHQSSFVNRSNLNLPPILSLTLATIPSLNHLPSKLISATLVSQDNEALESEDAVIEPKTGFKFPLFLSCNGTQDGFCSGLQELAGVGSRSMSLIKLRSIKLYAFGFYIRPDCLRAELGRKYNNISYEELEHESILFDDLLRYEIEMTIRLVVHYKGLKTSSVRSAFETSLKNRLKKIKGVDEDEGLHMFCSYFREGLSLSKGTVIDFHRRSGGQFQTEIDGRLVGTISSHDFCRAFFDLYIGDSPVSLKTKHEIGRRLGDMLRSR